MKTATAGIPFLMLMVFAVCFMGCGPVSAANSAVVTVDETRIVGQFNQELLGSNLQWSDNGDGLFSARGEIKAGALEAIRTLPAAGLRFPGGLLSSTYQWRQGTGPQGGRGMGPDFSGTPQKMVVGTDEYLDLLARTGWSGLITVNVTRTPEEAAAWVTHVLAVAPDAVRLWEVGNESYLNQEPSFMSAAEYVKRFNRFAKAIKLADPSAKVGAILEASLTGVLWAPVVIPETASWNKTVVAGTAGIADFYTVHLYAPFDAHQGDDIATLRTVQAAPLALGDNLRQARELVEKHAPGAPLLVTEFNLGMNEPLTAWKFAVSQAQAAYLAQMLALFSTNGVEGAYHWSLIGNHCFGQIISGDDPRLRPSAMLYNLLASLADARALLTQVDADVMRYKELGNVTSGLAPKGVFAQGYRQGDSLLVLVVNRRPDAPVDVTFQQADGAGLPLASGKLLAGDSPLSGGDTAPGSVRVVEVPVGPALTLPPCGVALVRLR